MNVDQLNFLSNLGGDSASAKNKPAVASMEAKVRMNFLKKVYSILAAQLTMNTLISAGIMMSHSVKMFVAQNTWTLYLNIVVSVVSVLALTFSRKSYPLNYILLALFTACNSFAIGMLVSMYDTVLVVQAFFLTAVVVIGLTVYAFTAKTDFKWLNASMTSLLGIMFFAGISQLFFRSPLMELGLSVLGAVLFSGFIIYDTQLVMKHISPEDYIIAVLNLYLDIVNLFIKILKLLNALKKEDSNERRSKKSSS